MKKSGFTLLEISIVLVIVGLIIGGVVLGQSLISSAQVRNTIRQIEKFDMAVNTFRLRYNCLPADCLNAISFGFATNGNGNGNIGDSYTRNATTAELSNFWNQLSVAGLIEETFLPNGTVPGRDSPKPAMPVPAKSGWVLWCDAGGASGTSAYGNTYSTHSYGLISTPDALYLKEGSVTMFSPTQAWAIDSKIDDGNPSRGKTRAYGERDSTMVTSDEACSPRAANGYSGGGAKKCHDTGGGTSSYNLDNTSENCVMVIKASF